VNSPSITTIVLGTVALTATALLLSAAPALAANQTLKVKVTGTGSVSANEGTISGCTESGGASCEGEYTEGTTVTLFAGHNERAAFAGWGGTCSGTEPTCKVTLSAAKEVEATFTAIPQQILTVTNPSTGPGGGTITGTSPGLEFASIDCGNGATTCTETYNQGTKIVLTVTANERSTFVGWTGCAESPSPNECELTLTAATEVKAEFAPVPQEALTVTNPGTGPGGGTTTGTSPGLEFASIDCGNGATTCTETYNEGAQIILSAAPNERSTFAGWGASECKSIPSPTECEVELSAAKSVKAEFNPIPQGVLTVEKTGTGNVTGNSLDREFIPFECGATCTAEYNQSTKILLSESHDERTSFVGWTGCTQIPSETECEVELSAAKSVKAKFAAIPQEALTVTTTEGTGTGTVNGSSPGPVFTTIECGFTCEAGYNQGAKLTLTATRATHSTFAGWEGCTRVISSNQFTASECEVEMTAGKTVKAKFAAVSQANLEVELIGSGTGELTSSPPGIACSSGTCTEHFDTEGPESTVTLTATPGLTSAFGGWSEIKGKPGTCTGSTSPCEVTTGESIKLKAKFNAIPQQQLTVATEGPGAVSGSAPPGFTTIECGSTCEAGYNEGAEIILTATPGPDNHLREWQGGGCSGAGTCHLTMSAGKTVKAVFTPTLHPLKLTPSGAGEVSATSPASGITGCKAGGGTCAGQYPEGSTVTLAASPAAHDHVAWSGCTHASADTCEVKVGSSEAEVQAAFSINMHTLTVARSVLGSVSADQGAISGCREGGGSCAGTYDEASTVTLTATPVAHYHFKEWEGCTHSAANTCEVQIGPSDALVKAIFAPNSQTLAVTPTGQGSVSATSGAISHCSATAGTCSGIYIEAATVTLTATPAAHQAVAWEGCTAAPSANTCEVEIGPSETNVKATFAQITHALTLTKDGSGSGTLTCNSAPCASAYPEGTALTLAASPASGSTFAGWSGGGCSGTRTCEVTLASDTTITATFNAKPPPPTGEKCAVPNLAGKTLGQARSELSAAHCSLGKVFKPKPKKGRKLGPLVVRSSSPAAGATVPADSKVNLDLGPKPRKKH